MKGTKRFAGTAGEMPRHLDKIETLRKYKLSDEKAREIIWFKKLELGFGNINFWDEISKTHDGILSEPGEYAEIIERAEELTKEIYNTVGRSCPRTNDPIPNSACHLSACGLEDHLDCYRSFPTPPMVEWPSSPQGEEFSLPD